jgi:hypothetical protein
MVSHDAFSVFFFEGSTSTCLRKGRSTYKVGDRSEKAARFVDPSTSPCHQAGWSSGSPPHAQCRQFIVPVEPDRSRLGGGGGGFTHPAVAAAVGRWWWEQGSVGPAGKALAPGKLVLAQAGHELGMQVGHILARGQGQGRWVAERGEGGVGGLYNNGYKTKEEAAFGTLGILQPILLDNDDNNDCCGNADAGKRGAAGNPTQPMLPNNNGTEGPASVGQMAGSAFAGAGAGTANMTASLHLIRNCPQEE